MRAHGTRARYVFGASGQDTGRGCRCAGYTEAQRVYNRERDRRSRRPDEVDAAAYVAAGSSRSHLLELAAAGVGLRQVAKVTGLGRTALSQIKSGETKRVRPETRAAIAAVNVTDGSGEQFVDAGPTWQLVERLQAAGMSKAAIARGIGTDPALQLSRLRVTRRNAEAVAALAAQVLEDEQAETIDENPWVAFARQARLIASWRERATCRGQDQRPWFPGRGDDTAAAKLVCSICPVRSACLDFALALDCEGVWGGTTGRERRQIKAAAALGSVA